MIVKAISRMTGKLNEMNINTTFEKLQKWESMPKEERPYIQDFFPELTPDEREFILSGATPEEFKEAFGED